MTSSVVIRVREFIGPRARVSIMSTAAEPLCVSSGCRKRRRNDTNRTKIECDETRCSSSLPGRHWAAGRILSSYWSASGHTSSTSLACRTKTKNQFWVLTCSSPTHWLFIKYIQSMLQPRIWGIGRPGRNVGYVTLYKRVYHQVRCRTAYRYVAEFVQSDQL